MFIGRFWVIIPVLAIAGSLAKKKQVPAGLGTLPTHTPLFVALLIGVILIVGALTFMPAWALGPIAEQLMAGRINKIFATRTRRREDESITEVKSLLSLSSLLVEEINQEENNEQ